MNDDIKRLRIEYEDRKRRFSGSDIYSLFNLANLFVIQQRQRAMVEMLQKNDLSSLANLKILEIGCGGGGVMTEYFRLGARQTNLFGIDLLYDRLFHANNILPQSSFANADGQSLPFPPETFNLVIQYMAISSILDSDIRKNIFIDMIRVLKPGGVIISYDFWWNPVNKQTRGLTLGNIRSSFPDCKIDFRKITLAPPLARRIVPVSWILALLLEKLKIFNSHYLVLIQPNSN